MKEVYSTYLQDAVAIRKHLHQIPELQYQEVETSAFIAKTLRSYGYQVQKNIGKTGVVAVLDKGYPGKIVAFWAVLDALPIEEETSLPYKPRNKWVMYACGHDEHTATLLLAPKIFQDIKASLKAKIKTYLSTGRRGW